MSEIEVCARGDRGIVEPVTEDGDGFAAALEGATVCGLVDTERHAGNNHDAALGEFACEFLGDANPIFGGFPGADNGDRGAMVRMYISAKVEELRRVGNFRKEFGIVAVRFGDQADVVAFECFAFVFGRNALALVHDDFREFPGDFGSEEFIERRLPCGFEYVEVRGYFPEFFGADTGDFPQAMEEYAVMHRKERMKILWEYTGVPVRWQGAVDILQNCGGGLDGCQK